MMIRTEILETDINRISRNHFDGTNFCRLRLRGPLCKARRQVVDDQPELCIWNNQEKTETRLREYDPEAVPLDGSEHMLVTWDTSRQAVLRSLKHSVDTSSKFVLLHIASMTYGKFVHVRGIVLHRTELHGTFKRAGYWRMKCEGDCGSSELLNAFNGMLRTLDVDDYLDADSDGQHTIDID